MYETSALRVIIIANLFFAERFFLLGRPTISALGKTRIHWPRVGFGKISFRRNSFSVKHHSAENPFSVRHGFADTPRDGTSGYRRGAAVVGRGARALVRGVFGEKKTYFVRDLSYAWMYNNMLFVYSGGKCVMLLHTCTWQLHMDVVESRRERAAYIRMYGVCISSLPPAKIRYVKIARFVRCNIYLYIRRVYNLKIKKKKKLFTLHTCYNNIVCILTFRRHFVLAGTSRQAACASRKIYIMTHCTGI